MPNCRSGAIPPAEVGPIVGIITLFQLGYLILMPLWTFLHWLYVHILLLWGGTVNV